MSVVEIEDGVYESTAAIDNGSFGTRTIRFETGRLAQQAAGSVVAYLDDETMLLSATTASKTPKEQFDFFPLTIDVEERMYAAGRIPGSFFRREGRPSTDAILTCRLIDRPLRPTFISGLRNEVQVVVTIMSLDPNDLYDVLAINAASASTQISGLPFNGPVGGVRVALIDGQWVAFPTVEQLERAVFDMVVAGRKVENDVAIMMVEAEATDNVVELIDGGAGAPTESVVAEGLEAAKPFIAALVDAQKEMADRAAKPTAEYPVFPEYGDDVYYSVASAATDELSKALTIAGKNERNDRTEEIKVEVLDRLAEQFAGREKEIGAAYRSLTKKLVRQRILTRPLPHRRPRHHRHPCPERRGGRRAAGARQRVVRARRDPDPRRHHAGHDQDGPADRLVGPRDQQAYMHHYNFPPYSTGETGRVGSPKRREIGHGALAERALVPVLPSIEEFPYAIRQVSEALSSNGSTSMGSVCASTLALLNAGVPLKAPVAGIAMGLVSDDVEIEGRGTERVRRADRHPRCRGRLRRHGLQGRRHQGVRHRAAAGHQARRHPIAGAGGCAGAGQGCAADDPRGDGRGHRRPRRDEPVRPADHHDQGAGGQDRRGHRAQGQDDQLDHRGDRRVDLDRGRRHVFVGATNGASAQAAIDKINAIANPQLPKIGERFLGTVVKTTDFGAFVSLVPGRDGLVHISKLGRGKRIAKVEDVVNVGDKLRVEIADIDNRGKISLILVAEEETADTADTGATPVDAATASG